MYSEQKTESLMKVGGQFNRFCSGFPRIRYQCGGIIANLALVVFPSCIASRLYTWLNELWIGKVSDSFFDACWPGYRLAQSQESAAGAVWQVLICYEQVSMGWDKMFAFSLYCMWEAPDVSIRPSQTSVVWKESWIPGKEINISS